MAKAQVHKFACMLILLDKGLLLESQEFSVIFDKNAHKPAEKASDESEDESSEEQVDESNISSIMKRRINWIRDVIEKKGLRKDNTTPSDAAISDARRLLIKSFLAEILLPKKCFNCSAFTPNFKKDGFSKIFEEAMAPKHKAYMDQHGRSRDNIMSLSKSGFEDRVYQGVDDDKDHIQDDASAVLTESEDEDADLISSSARQSKTLLKKDARATKYVTSEEVQRYMRKLFVNESQIMKLLYRGKTAANPDVFFLSSVLVPPVKFRPASVLGDTVHENVQNDLLTQILSSSNRIRELSASIASKTDQLSKTGEAQAYDQLINTFVTLQHNVNSLIDSNRNPTKVGQNRELPPGIKQVLEKKEGLFRKHMMGKRVNYAARSVISPDPNIETSEIGVPPVFARKLTYPEPVTAHNYSTMRQAVINGALNHPGATHIQNEDGSIIALVAMSLEGRKALANQLLTPQHSHGSGFDASRVRATNKKVLRHLRDGDILLLNRQPTLHKPSIMAHKAKILTGEKTIRMHYANCNTYNADFDGDEMNMHFPQNENARAEAAMIANTDNQYLVPTSGDPLRGLIQDHVVIAVWMTNKDTFFTREEYQQLLYGTIRPEEELDSNPRIVTVAPAILKPRQLWTGKQIITTLLANLKPERMYGLNLESKCKVAGKYWGPDSEEGKVIFKDGALMTGILDKSQFGASAYGMVHSIYELYGPEYAGKLLSMLGRLFTKYAQMRAFTCRMDDLRLHDEGNQWRKDLLQAGRNAGTEASSVYVGLPDNVDSTNKDLRVRLEEVLRDDEKLQGLDAAMKGKMNKLTSAVIDKCIPEGLLRKFPFNHMQTMTVSGAKGSNVNVSQISCLLGQQELEGRRVPIMVSGKTLPSFKPFDTSAKAGGFIAGRFLTGIKPQEYYFHCMAGREGLIDTAVKTSRSGYLQRCLIKHLEGIKVNYDSTVRDADGSVIQMNYGEDSLDVIKSKHLTQFAFSAANHRSISQRIQPKGLINRPGLNFTSKGHKLMKKAVKKPLKYAPPLSTNDPAREIGIVSEAFHEKLEEYIEQNPDGILIDKEKAKEAGSLTPEVFRLLMQIRYQMSLVEPGEAVGILASQSVGEPSTQMTLNTFHFAGFGAKNVTLGIPRLREIIMTASADIKTPTMSMKLLPGVKEVEAERFAKDRTRVLLSQLVENVEVQESLKLSGGVESKRYRVKLNLFSEKEYNDEYNVTKTTIESVIARLFLRKFKDKIEKKSGVKATAALKKDDDIAEIGKAAKSTTQSKKAQEYDDNVVAEVGINEEEGEDGDATDERLHDRAKMKISYEQPDEEEEAIMKAAASDSDADNDSIDVDMQSEDEQDIRDSEGEEEHDRRKAGEAALLITKSDSLATARRSYGNVFDFDFDHKSGSSCTIGLEYPLETPKFLMVNLIEAACQETVVQELPGIIRCFRTPSEGLDESRLLATDGVNFKGFWNTEGIISYNDMYSNDIAAIGRTYGVEAMRQAIIKEVSGVFAVYGIGVDTRHLSLIADYMTFDGRYKPFSRIGIESNPSPLLKMTYETTCTFLTQAALHGLEDDLVNPSAKIVMGKLTGVGTGSFDIRADMQNK